MSFVNMPLFFLLGSLFPVSQLPEILQKTALVNPLYYSIELLRRMLVDYFTIQPLPAVFVLGLLLIAALLIGRDKFNKIEP
ncbi:MAG: hypothetical protein GF335_05130 [Candidatus Moranbacteria bacterium]|nr:hypothetical protein [Candidatus Moranbacteria bacterium]